jgi:hypothetical protein
MKLLFHNKKFQGLIIGGYGFIGGCLGFFIAAKISMRIGVFIGFLSWFILTYDMILHLSIMSKMKK